LSRLYAQVGQVAPFTPTQAFFTSARSEAAMAAASIARINVFIGFKAFSFPSLAMEL